MIDSGAFDAIGRPSMRLEGPTSWSVWLRILDSAASGNRCGRVKCGVLYHVAQMKVYFHGEEQPTRELLLPRFEAWTYVSLGACPERRPGAAFAVPSNVVSSLDHAEDTHLQGSSVHSGPTVDADVIAGERLADASANVALGTTSVSMPSVNVASVVSSVPHANAQPVHSVPGGPLPSVPGAGNAPAFISSPELVALSQLLNQVVQTQVQMQQQLSDIWDCLGRGSSSGVNGLLFPGMR